MAGPARAYSGRLLRLFIEDPEAPEGFALVGGLRTTAVSLDHEAVEVTTVASEGFRELLPQGGLRSLTLAGEGVVASGASDRALYLQAVEGSAAAYRLDFGNGDRFEGSRPVSILPDSRMVSPVFQVFTSSGVTVSRLTRRTPSPTSQEISG